MKTTTLEKANYGAALAMLGGVVVGVLGSNAAISVVHDPTSTNAILSKYLMAKRAIMVAGGTAGGAIITSTDNTSLFLKSACYGVAGNQAVKMVGELVDTKIPASGTTTNKILRTSLGLSCPGDMQAQLWGAKRRKPARRSLGIPAAPMLDITANPLEAHYEQGMAMTA